jgi:hypothetical protein
MYLLYKRELYIVYKLWNRLNRCGQIRLNRSRVQAENFIADTRSDLFGRPDKTQRG